MDHTEDCLKDAASLIAAILREAHRRADLVDAFLTATGFCPPRDQRNGRTYPLPADLLLKLGALVKLFQWDRCGLMPHLAHSLPTWQEVYADVLAETKIQPPRFSGADLSRRILRVFIGQIAWRPLESAAAETAILHSADQDDLVDRLAEFVWQFRHLTKRGEQRDDSKTKE